MSQRTTTTEKIDTKAELLEAKSHAAQAIVTGRQTLERLQLQEETLNSSEDTLEANEYALDKAMQTLRGMTWSGYMYNQYKNVASVVSSKPPSVEEVHRNRHGRIKEKDNPNNHLNNSYNQTIDFRETNSNKSEEDKELDKIYSAVELLHEIGLTMGDQLINQNKALDDMDRRTEVVTDKTLAVTLKASQLSRNSNRYGAKFVGLYQFMEPETGKFLALNGDNIILSDVPERSTYFNCFVKAQSLIGIQSEKTKKFLGCTMWGTIAAAATYFGKQEECHLELDGRETGILFLARNWGSGGWLKHTSDSDASGVLSDSTSDIRDKVGMIKFKVLKLSEKEENLNQL